MSTAVQHVPAAVDLRLEGIHKQFGAVPVLRGVDLTIRGGEVLGLVGENGAGKSSLMNILAGDQQADSGSMRIAGRPHAPQSPAEALKAGVAFVHQELTLFPNLTIAENVQLVRFPRWRGWPFIDRAKSLREVTMALARVGLHRSARTQVAWLSPGERQLVEIARALVADARVLILDEPTTSLGVAERDRLHVLVRELRAAGMAVVYISHELGDVLRECDRLAVLRDGRVVAAGPVSAFTPETIVRHMVGRDVRQVYPRRRESLALEPLLSVENAAGTRVRDVRFTVHRGEIVGLFGLMGAGRTELVRLLFGLEPQRCGQVLLDGVPLAGGPSERIKRGLALVPEDRRAEGLCLDAPIGDNFALASLRAVSRLGILDHDALSRAVRRAAADARLTGASDLEAPVRSLSGGNQQKVVLGKWLLTQPRLLMLDEPTRGVDVAARVEIYEILHRLVDGGAGLLVVSSELEELTGLCDRILVMRDGVISGSFRAAEFARERLLRAALPESVG